MKNLESNNLKLRRVLFVDDEPLVLQALARQVSDVFDVRTASSGHDAIGMMRSGERFAVIVSDMMMPGMSGLEFLHHARILDPDAILMMLTGNSDWQTAIDAVEEGRVFHFLMKPCNRERLIKSIEAGLQLHRLQARIENIREFLKKAA